MLVSLVWGWAWSERCLHVFCINQCNCCSISGSGMEPLSTWSCQKVKIGMPYHKPPFTSTRSYVLNSSPVSFFLAVHSNHSLTRSVVPLGRSFGTGGLSWRITGYHTTVVVEIACTAFLCSRSCLRRSFLIFTFFFILQSSQMVFKYICSGIFDSLSCWKFLLASQCNKECVHFLWKFVFLSWCLGEFCFLLLFSSSTSASLLEGFMTRIVWSCWSCCPLLFCLEEGWLAVWDAIRNYKDSEGWWLHMGVIWLSMTLVILGIKCLLFSLIKFKNCKEGIKRWLEFSMK